MFYARYLLAAAENVAKGSAKMEGITGLGLMRFLPQAIEPMITLAAAESTVIPEIYLRMICAIACHNTDDDVRAAAHIDRAIALALPDGLLGILAEHRRQPDYLLDDRLRLADEEAHRRYRQLYKGLLEGWTRLHNALLDRSVSANLSVRERQIARLAACGCSNAEISVRMQISESSAKKAIYDAMNKTGVDKRRKLGAFV